MTALTSLAILVAVTVATGAAVLAGVLYYAGGLWLVRRPTRPPEARVNDTAVMAVGRRRPSRRVADPHAPRRRAGDRRVPAS